MKPYRVKRTYPEHLCCSWTRMTTNKTNCAPCLSRYLKMPYTPVSDTLITANAEPAPRRRRNESQSEV